MSEKQMRRIILWIIIAFIGIIGLILQNQEDYRTKQQRLRTKLPSIPQSRQTYKRLRTYDTRKEEYIWYTDSEIRLMRENLSYHNDGKYYLKIPGRTVLPIDDMIEEYIDDNIDEIIENH